MRAPGSPAADSDSGEALRNLQRQFLEGVALAEASPPRRSCSLFCLRQVVREHFGRKS